MNDKNKTIALISLFIFLIILANTKSYLAVLVFIALLDASNIIYQVYKYNEKRHQISELSLKLKRENVFWPIFNVLIIITIIYNYQTNPLITSNHSYMNNILNIILCISLILNAFIGIFQKPILSTSGFLCSSGQFIDFTDLNDITIKDDNSILHNKRISLTYKTNKSYIFIVSNDNYSEVKNILNLFACIPIKEKF